MGSRAWICSLWQSGLTCPVACVIFLEQGLNPCPLHWQADSELLNHQESPSIFCTWFFFLTTCKNVNLLFNSSLAYHKMPTFVGQSIVATTETLIERHCKRVKYK